MTTRSPPVIVNRFLGCCYLPAAVLFGFVCVIVWQFADVYAQAVEVGTAWITRIQSQSVQPSEGVVIDVLYDGEGIDVSGDYKALPTGQQIWLCLKRQDERWFRAFGPAQRRGVDSEGQWTVHGVVLPHEAAAQSRHYAMYVALVSQAMPPDKAEDAHHPCSGAVATVPPVELAVLRWLSAAKGVTFEAVGGMAVDSRESLEADSHATLTGRVTNKDRGSVYLLIHPSRSQSWRIVGPAEIVDDRWTLRDVPLAEPAQPQWRFVDVVAVQFDGPMTAGPIAYEAYREKVRTVSPQLTLRLRDDPPVVPRVTPEVKITKYEPTDANVTIPDLLKNANSPNHDNRNPERPENRPSEPVREILLRGTVSGLPEGRSLWALVNPLGSGLWVAQEGPASILADGWTLPRVVFDAPWRPGTASFWLVIAVCGGAPPGGGIGYESLQSYCAIVAGPFLATTTGPPGLEAAESGLVIARIGDQTVEDNAEVRIESGTAPEIEIAALGGAPTGQVLVGWSQPGVDDWRFIPSVRAAEERWLVPRLSLDGLTKKGESGPPEFGGTISLIAVASHTGVPGNGGGYNSWRARATAVSQIVKVRVGPASDSLALTDGEFEMFWLAMSLVIAMILLVILVRLVAWRFRQPTAAAATVQSASPEPASPNNESVGYGAPRPRTGGGSERISAAVTLMRERLVALTVFIENQVGDAPRERLARSVLGLVLLGIGLYAIFVYFPLYQHAVASVLGLSKGSSHSLALLLVVFTGVAGILIDTSYRYGRDAQSGDCEFTCMLVVALTTGLAVALLVFQALLYCNFYAGRPGAATSDVPFLLMLASGFISGIELMNFYWASTLAFDFLVWLIVYTGVILPLRVLDLLLQITERLVSVQSNVRTD